MCVVSDKIKFCTCVEGAFEEGAYEELPHYWLLHRFNKQKGCEVMGMPVMPLDYLQPNYLLNAQTLGDRINEKDAFDKIIKFKPKDQLEIVINNLSDDELDRMSFCFIFKKGKWIEKEYDVFEIMSHYDELAFGNFDKLNDK
jgi:hypothetical protein